MEIVFMLMFAAGIVIAAAFVLAAFADYKGQSYMWLIPMTLCVIFSLWAFATGYPEDWKRWGFLMVLIVLGGYAMLISVIIANNRKP